MIWENSFGERIGFLDEAYDGAHSCCAARLV